MSNEKKYRYVKFARLSDAVRAYEDGVGIYFMHQFEHCRLKSGSFSNLTDYYRREEVKPFELWAIRHKETGYILATKAIEETPVCSSDYEVIKMREVIE